MSLLGKVVEDRVTKAQYVVYRTDGNNPPVATNTKCAHLVNIDTGKGWFYTQPQRFVTVPLNFLYNHFTETLSRRPASFDPKILVPVD